jgi:hypothetical protein
MQSIVQQKKNFSRRAARLPWRRANAGVDVQKSCVSTKSTPISRRSALPEPKRYREADRILAIRTKLKYPAIMRTPPTGVEGPTILVKAPILSG